MAPASSSPPKPPEMDLCRSRSNCKMFATTKESGRPTVPVVDSSSSKLTTHTLGPEDGEGGTTFAFASLTFCGSLFPPIRSPENAIEVVNDGSGSKSGSEDAPESPPADDTVLIVCVGAAGPPQSTSIAVNVAFARDGVG